MPRLFNFTIAAVVLGFSAMVDGAMAYGSSPACESTKVLSKIIKRFNRTEHVYWQRGSGLSEIQSPHLHSGRGFADSMINRRYCHATAIFTDGRTRKMHFLIEDGAGFAGFGWNVEYCIHGLDPWHYYDGKCRVMHR